MRRIIKVVGVEHRLNKHNKLFYLSTVVLDDNETYTLAHSAPAKIGEEVEAWFDDRWQRPVAKYPKEA